jgi:TPP-dependent pyruvate/acetoin dehydrogenase alpha subunit
MQTAVPKYEAEEKLSRADIADEFELCWAIREFETQLLDIFSKGLVTGTTHTCWGQEVVAVGILKSLPATTAVFSNHRSHGHFLAATEDYTKLLHEILGYETGLNYGIGGSQHLCLPGRFYSNGVLGGTIAMACGYAWGRTLLKKDGLSVVFLGDGGMGEGACYESFNMARLRRLPVIFVVENNAIAQSTDTISTTAGTLEGRFAAFDIPVTRISDGDIHSIQAAASKAARQCAGGQGPVALIVDIPRLGPHSKGDDTRDTETLQKLSAADPLHKMIAEIGEDQASDIKAAVREKIRAIYEEATKPDHKHALDRFSQDWHVLSASPAPVVMVWRATASWMAFRSSLIWRRPSVRNKYSIWCLLANNSLGLWERLRAFQRTARPR